MDRLPEDLWIQIFLRLPVKTILRCLSVCKSWQLFVQNPSFISSHLQHQRRNLLLVRNITPDHENGETTLAKKENPECYSLYSDEESFTVYAKHEFPIRHWTEHYRIVGSCNGIICITDDDFGTCHDTYLWNPTIRKYVELPRPMFTFDKVGGFEHELGFGFDEKNNDYKVVRIVDCTDWDEGQLKVEIYSLSSGIWRKASHLASDLSVGIFPRACGVRNCQVYHTGTLYWVGGDWDRCMVIAFHLGDEVFRCFEPPLDIEHEHYWMRKLRPIVFQGSLSLIHYDKPKCSIWMMKDYEDSTLWEKVMDANLSTYVDRVIGLRKNGELLIEIRGGLYSYAPTEGKELNYLDEINFHFWKIIQGGHPEGIEFNPDVYNYDPKYAPKELEIRNKREDFFGKSFHSESYTESLVLLGRIQSAEVAKLKKKKKKKKKKKVVKLRTKNLK